MMGQAEPCMPSPHRIAARRPEVEPPMPILLYRADAPTLTAPRRGLSAFVALSPAMELTGVWRAAP